MRQFFLLNAHMKNANCELHLFIVSNLRMKIETIIAKSTPVPDSDCPEDAESVRFWCNIGGKSTQKETTTVAATAEAHLATTQEGLSSILGVVAVVAVVVVAVVAVVAAVLPEGHGGTANRPTIKALVDIANETEAPAPKAKSKAKAKAKNKSKVSEKNPKTPAERRQSIRPLVVSIKNKYM